MGIIENKKIILHKSNSMLRRRRQLNKILKALGAVVLLLGILVGIYYMSFRGRREVYLAEYTVITLKGYNGDGFADVHLQKEGDLKAFLDTVEPKADRSTGLSNGDIVTINYTYDKKLARANKLKVRAGRQRIKVEGLIDATVITKEALFENCEVSFHGASPRVEVELTNISEDEVLSQVEFVLAEDYSSLKTGDSVVIEAIVDRAVMAREAYALESDEERPSKTIEIPVMDKYADNASLISEADLRALIDDGKSVFAKADRDASSYGLSAFSEAGILYNLKGTKYTFKWGNVGFISAYFNHCIDLDKLPQEQEINDIRIVYETTISQSDGQTVPVEAVVIFRNIVIDSNGRVELPLGQGELVAVSTSDKKIKSFVRGLDEELFDTYRFEYYY